MALLYCTIKASSLSMTADSTRSDTRSSSKKLESVYPKQTAKHFCEEFRFLSVVDDSEKKESERNFVEFYFNTLLSASKWLKERTNP